jgi:hypothetical protein
VKAEEKRRVAKALAISTLALLVAVVSLGMLALYVFGAFKQNGPASSTSPSPNTNSLPREVVAGLLKDLTGAELPAEAQEVYGLKASLFATVIELRFTCREYAFKRMQITSQHLDLPLNPANSVDLRGGNLAWWKPEELVNVRHGTKQWTLGADHVSCDLLTGQAKDSTNITAYVRFILERMPK